ncbi:hypothetical protein GCM10022280_16630 [Sphingomonas swuensis]|uniref:ABC transporter ATP-binding protein n=1 Tax=Sphingomonas swuensis TaxID=977800 RepID=A0ABP7SXH0_9SPHN
MQALGSDGRRRLVALALLTIAGAAAEFGTLVALLRLLRSWLTGAHDDVAAGSALLFAVVVLAAGVIRFGLLVATQRLAFETAHRLTVAVQRRVLARGWLAHAQARASAPLAALDQVDLLVYSVLLPLLQGASALVLGGAILAALIRIDVVTALAAALLLGGLFFLALWLCRGRTRRAGAAVNAGYEARIAAVQENVGAMRELILAGSRGVAAERFRKVDRGFSDARASISIINATPRILVETLGLIALIGLAWWVTDRSDGLAPALPTLAALALGAQRLLPLAQSLAQAVSGITANGAAIDRVTDLLNEADLTEHAPAPPLPFQQQIRLDSVGFHYPGRNEAALSDIDLTIARGERIALVGRNGSGKSSLADVIMGLIKPSWGRLFIDSHVLEASEDVRAWQRNVAHVPQAPFLADTTMAANIAFMDGHPDHARVVEAARLAGLHAMIDALPRGYETRVGSGGLMLSGGQRQRLALARALYAPAPLLVLDEATSALDPESEEHVLAALDALQERGVTILLIAHRASMLEHCDRIIRLQAGRIVEP